MRTSSLRLTVGVAVTPKRAANGPYATASGSASWSGPLTSSQKSASSRTPTMSCRITRNAATGTSPELSLQVRRLCDVVVCGEEGREEKVCIYALRGAITPIYSLESSKHDRLVLA